MESSDVGKPMTTAQAPTDQEMKVGKSYLAPALKRLSPEAAKGVLLQHADVGNPEVQQMLDRVDELQGEKGS
jgi:hypothetical protein